MMDRRDMIEALRWQVEAGADEALGDAPVDRFSESARPEPTATQPTSAPRAEAPPPAMPQAPAPRATMKPVAPRAATPLSPAPGPGAASAQELAGAAQSLDDLRAALEGFTGCALRQTATNLVFCDGNPKARLLLIGEAPGAEEDRQGVPFVGAAGQMLDRMLAAIGQDRTTTLITNTIYWRPPGNRNPAPDEIAACLPFVERVIEINDPAILVLVGGIATKTLLATNDGIMKLHGKWTSFETPRMSRPVPCMPIYHPAFLLRSPGQKRAAWRDLLEIRQRLDREMADNP